MLVKKNEETTTMKMRWRMGGLLVTEPASELRSLGTDRVLPCGEAKGRAEGEAKGMPADVPVGLLNIRETKKRE